MREPASGKSVVAGGKVRHKYKHTNLTLPSATDLNHNGIKIHTYLCCVHEDSCPISFPFSLCLFFLRPPRLHPHSSLCSLYFTKRLWSCESTVMVAHSFLVLSVFESLETYSVWHVPFFIWIHTQMQYTCWDVFAHTMVPILPMYNVHRNYGIQRNNKTYNHSWFVKINASRGFGDRNESVTWGSTECRMLENLIHSQKQSENLCCSWCQRLQLSSEFGEGYKRKTQQPAQIRAYLNPST